jgi:tRNA (cytidine32/uridine32-2'-O)-methyltransferase
MNSHKVRFVLINTTHPGNIGASARAIKNMNFDELFLVSPRLYPHEEANARASGAEDVLKQARVFSSFQEAVRDCHLLFGTSSRQRALPIPLLTARQGAIRINEALRVGQKVAVLFGQERIGLTNDELSACHYHLMIPCNPLFPSLNLAAAVQIIAYELHLALQDVELPSSISSWVNTKEMEAFYSYLQETLIKLEFLNPRFPGHLMRKLRRLFNRIMIEENEMNILRGILAAIRKKIE